MKDAIRRSVAVTAVAALLSLTTLFGARADEAILLPDGDFFPEGIAADSLGGLYVGSLVQGRIIYLDPGSHTPRSFVAAGENGLVSVLGVHVADDGDLLYACSSDPGFGKLTGSAKPALVAFHTADGSSAGRFELPSSGICNDITELRDGTILATDSVNPRIYALSPGSESLGVWLEDERFAGDGFNLNGIAAVSGAVFVVRYNTGSLFRVSIGADGTPSEVREIALERALEGPDGLEALSDNELLLVEGGGLSAGSRGRLSKIKVNGNTGKIELVADDLNVPTTVALSAGVAYVVEGQLDHLFDPAAGAPDSFKVLPIALD